MKDYNLYSMVEKMAPEVIAEERKIYKGVSANVDFYSGFVYSMLDLPLELYTPMFAVARIVGWSAHRMEELINTDKYSSVLHTRMCLMRQNMFLLTSAEREQERRMFRCFFPDEYLESAYAVDYEKLYQEGYRGLLFDIDNTLVPHGAPADDRAIELFTRLRAIGFKSCFISNNQIERVASFNEKIGERFIENAHKPATGNYKKAMELLGTDCSNTIFIGVISFLRMFMVQKEPESVISW